MTTLLLLLVLHGLFLAALLATVGRRAGRGNGALALLLSAMSLLLFEFYAAVSGLSRRQPHGLGVVRPVWLLIGPLVYGYVLRFLGRAPGRRFPLLYLPAAALTLWMVPFFALPAAEKLTVRPHAAGIVVFALAFSGLTAWCAWAARQAVRAAAAGVEAADHPVPPPVPWRAGWLRLLLASLAVHAVLDAAATLWFLARGGYPAGVALISLMVMTTVIYATGVLVVVPDGLLARSPWPGKKQQRSGLGDDAAGRLAARLEALMRDERPWLEDGLGLGDLALRLGVSRHQLSELVNQHLGTTFRDYVNRHRIAEAQRLLRDMGSRRSMLDIGLDAGFGSSATFYRAFKKHVGMTPKDYLAQTAGSDADRFTGRAGSGR